MNTSDQTLLGLRPLKPKVWTAAWTIGLAVLVGLLVQLALNSLTGRPMILAFFGSVLFVGWRSGFVAGLWSILLSCVVADFFIFQPSLTFHLPSSPDLLTLVGFALLSTVGVGVTSRLAKTTGLMNLAQIELETTLNSIGDGVVVVDREQRISMLNPIAEKLTGWTDREARGLPMDQVFRIVNQSTRQPAFNPIEKVIHEGIVVGLANHTVLISKSGEEYQIEDSSAPIQLKGSDQVIGVILVFRDVTSKYATESRSRETREKFEAVIEELSDGIVLSDGDGGNFQMNQAALELHGFLSSEQMFDRLEKYLNIFKLDTLDHQLIDPQNWPLARVLRGEKFHDVEAIVTRLDNGHTFVGSYSGTPIFDGNGRVNLAVLTLRDISEKTATEAQLRRAKEEAEIASNLKTAFLANMSHEIRTPLGAILGFTELMKDAESPLDRAEYAGIITRNGKSLTKIIDDILDLSKVEAGRLELEKLEFNLPTLIEEVKSLFIETALKKGIALTSHLDPMLPASVISDPTRIRQILINLIGNAIKFTAHGAVEIGIAPIFSKEKISHIQLTVKDTGVGLSQDQINKLFEPFSQADNSTTRKFGGTGLGLALSRRLAVAMGGDIRVAEARVGQGSTFVATVGAEAIGDSELDSGNSLSMTAKDDLSSVKVLLVEDSLDNQLLVIKLLARHGIQVEAVNNGQEAVEKPNLKEFDMILMDMQMPVLDGYAATEQLRDMGFKKPIIALTAHAMADERKRTRLSGCDAHLTKPIDSTLLIRTISQFWQRGSH